jgi:hypothetical protein
MATRDCPSVVAHIITIATLRSAQHPIFLEQNVEEQLR